MDDMVMIHGYAWPRGMGITKEKVEALAKLPPRKDDILIVSYPRSGSKLFNSFLLHVRSSWMVQM